MEVEAEPNVHEQYEEYVKQVESDYISAEVKGTLVILGLPRTGVSLCLFGTPPTLQGAFFNVQANKIVNI